MNHNYYSVFDKYTPLVLGHWAWVIYMWNIHLQRSSRFYILHIYVYVCMHACMYVCMYVQYVRTYVCMHVCINYMYVCMYVCMYIHIYVSTHFYTLGTINEGPSTVIYFPGQTMLPIELICNVTGFPTWIVTINGTENEYTPNALASGDLAGHDIDGINCILINVPVNNSKYICNSNVGSQRTSSDPAFVYIASKDNLRIYIHV